jgi:superfamily II DNA/RNA helicase
MSAASTVSTTPSSGAAAAAAAIDPVAPGPTILVDDLIVTGVSADFKPVTDFNEMELPDNLARGIYAHGFERPSKIQRVAILPMKQGRDILAQSQSGTGKTGTFLIGALSNVDPSVIAPQVLVVNPVRELAEQTQKEAHEIGEFMGLRAMSATGGTPVMQDIRNLSRGVHVVSGTPGRIYDLINRGALNLDRIQYLILDEADQMLDDLFSGQIKAILDTHKFPTTTRLAMFSATMPDEVLELADTFLQNPVRILLKTEEISLKGIKQFHIGLDREDFKFDALMDLYKHLTINQAIIFVNKRQRAEQLTRALGEEGFALEFIHGDMDPSERRRRLNEFRAGRVRVLVATDVLARGIDVQTVSMVVNFDMPMNRENYFHRIGRCGRYGRKGMSINLLSGDMEFSMQKDIERFYDINIPELPADLDEIRKHI